MSPPVMAIEINISSSVGARYTNTAWEGDTSGDGGHSLGGMRMIKSKSPVSLGESRSTDACSTLFCWLKSLDQVDESDRG